MKFEEQILRHREIDSANLEMSLETEKLYVGDLFGEKGFGWAMNDIARLSALHSAFVKKPVSVLLAHHVEDTAIRLLNKLFSRNELDEETVELLLRAYATKKDQGSFMKLYKRYAKRLRQELNIDPSKELEDLYARLQTSLNIG